eukprot:CAMPEP_0197022040 /NCGR_PEP_ID=MMETSP1384-20130603/2954_1 /TAXON_ID=29189 /ORGANISM="Ammonia sp." /LENGTH=81 /DNA_ID=CAMNT_0042450003 /DNA_START=222 /DNA_END=467 /DNA_ORIENTATION=-
MTQIDPESFLHSSSGHASGIRQAANAAESSHVASTCSIPSSWPGSSVDTSVFHGEHVHPLHFVTVVALALVWWLLLILDTN